jgi:hypothetical protein
VAVSLGVRVGIRIFFRRLFRALDAPGVRLPVETGVLVDAIRVPVGVSLSVKTGVIVPVTVFVAVTIGLRVPVEVMVMLGVMVRVPLGITVIAPFGVTFPAETELDVSVTGALGTAGDAGEDMVPPQERLRNKQGARASPAMTINCKRDFFNRFLLYLSSFRRLTPQFTLILGKQFLKKIY